MHTLPNWRSAWFSDGARGARNHELMCMTSQVLPLRPISKPLRGPQPLGRESETRVVRV